MTAANPSRRRRRHRFCSRRNHRFRHRTADSAFLIPVDTAAYFAVVYTVAELPPPRLFLCCHIGLLCSCLVPARPQSLDRFRRLKRFFLLLHRLPAINQSRENLISLSLEGCTSKDIHLPLPQRAFHMLCQHYTLVAQ